MSEVKTQWAYGGYGKVRNQGLSNPTTQQEYVEAVFKLAKTEAKVWNTYEATFNRLVGETDKVYLRRCAKLDYNSHRKSREFTFREW